MSSLEAVRRLFGHPLLEPLASTALLARLVCDPARFALAEVAGRGRVVAHRLRESGIEVLLEHGSPDVEAFDELFYQRIYEPPAEVVASLARARRPLQILDVGANIGLFGAWALGHWPDARIEAFEPDPRNAALHRRTIARNGREESWQLHEAAAAAEDGSLAFAAGRYAMSGPADRGDADAIVVPAVNVLPAIVRSDLVKIDAEGSEWAILGDPRFASTAVTALALEYHPELCPGPDARSAAHVLLANAGYEVCEVATAAPPGYGSLWAWRAG